MDQQFEEIQALLSTLPQQEWSSEDHKSASLIRKIFQLQDLLLQVQNSDGVEQLVDHLIFTVQQYFQNHADRGTSSRNPEAAAEQNFVEYYEQYLGDSTSSEGIVFDAKPEEIFPLYQGAQPPQKASGTSTKDHCEFEEDMPLGSYDLIELEASEILAEHTHFCEICGKGFKRDANLRMHMRGHGDEFKSSAALARPLPGESGDGELPALTRRYSCPFPGCRRNSKSPAFVPLKTLLCVKNHYRRSHCPKLLTCSKCSVKSFSVTADLRTHEKHCGRQRWLCSCGTSFSRKDKLLGHVSLFLAGHVAVAPTSPTGQSIRA